MLIDDSDDELFLTQSFLRRAGAEQEFVLFTSGDAVMEELEAPTVRTSSGIAAFFIDVKMPGLTGLELLEWIRGQAGYATVPIVMCSSSDAPRDVTRAAKGGAQGYITKYPTTEALRELIARLGQWGADAADLLDVECNLLLKA